MHRITNRIAEGFIEITVSGFWEADHIVEFAADLRAAIRAFPATGSPPASLYNFTDAAIQPQDVVGAMQGLAAAPDLAGRKVALYTEGAFARLQAKRVAAVRDNMRIFGSRAEAIAWLKAKDHLDVVPAYAARR